MARRFVTSWWHYGKIVILRQLVRQVKVKFISEERSKYCAKFSKPNGYAKTNKQRQEREKVIANMSVKLHVIYGDDVDETLKKKIK